MFRLPTLSQFSIKKLLISFNGQFQSFQRVNGLNEIVECTDV